MSKKRRKNPSARDRRRARQTAAHDGRTAAGACPLFRLNPPFRGYRRWLTPTNQAPVPGDLPEKAATVLAMVTGLAPLYQGQVPLAALYLEQQIRAGALLFPSGEGAARTVPLPDMATVLAESAHHFPGEPVMDGCGCDVGRMLHELHAEGGFVLDDDQVIRLAVLV